MKSIYIVKIKSKYFNKLFRYGIYINNIKKINKDEYLLYLDLDNYNKILKFKKIFEIEFIDYRGYIKYKNIFRNNIVFFIMFVISLFYIIFLSNVIFSIEIKTTNKDLNNLVMHELNRNDISLYKFVKSFETKEKIKKKILNDNKNSLEWLEITRHGSKYIVNVEERIIKNIDNDNTPTDIVASKNAIILSIEARSGSIVKKLNDYVKCGDIIVTGSITHKEEVVDKIRADAIIYGETWYKVHVSYPMSYYEKTYTSNKSNRLKIKVLNKNIIIGKKYKEEEIKERPIIYNKFLPIRLSLEKVQETVLIDDLYTVDEAYEEGLKLARIKLLKGLGKDSKILSEKKLKIIVNNSTIDVDIFFKVYENITEIRRIEE